MAIGKRLKKAREGVDREQLYPLADAINMVKERAKSKFDEEKRALTDEPTRDVIKQQLSAFSGFIAKVGGGAS